MLKQVRWLLLLIFMGFGGTLTAQSNQSLTQAFGTALGRGDVQALTVLLDDEVQLIQPGENGTYHKQAVTGKLAAFLRQNPPVGFLMKHQGSSADGQVYAIGQLTTQSGSHYKVLLRAKPAGSQYRIFKLDLLQNL